MLPSTFIIGIPRIEGFLPKFTTKVIDAEFSFSTGVGTNLPSRL